MTQSKKHIILAVFLLYTSRIMASPPVKDTVVNGQKITFNTLTLYGNPTDLSPLHPVLCMGTIGTDSVKTGTWYFFYPSGELLAKGRYVDGYKKGVWTYYSPGKNTNKIKWSKETYMETVITFDQHNNPVIKDVTGKGIELFNGRVRNTYAPVSFN